MKQQKTTVTAEQKKALDTFTDEQALMFAAAIQAGLSADEAFQMAIESEEPEKKANLLVRMGLKGARVAGKSFNVLQLAKEETGAEFKSVRAAGKVELEVARKARRAALLSAITQS